MPSMHCYFCDQTSPEGSLFCKPCGSPFHLAPCPRCAAVNDLKVVSCYKCKAILPIRRAETKQVATNNVVTNDVVAHDKNVEPVIEQKLVVPASELAVALPSFEVASAHESTSPAPIEESPAPSIAILAAANNAETSAVNGAATADVSAGADTNGDSYQKTIVLQRATVDVHEVEYQKTIPVRRPLEKVHDEDYQTTIALQRAPADASQYLPADIYDANYQKTIALQRALHPAPIEVHDDAYVKTISLRHPPPSLAGGTAPKLVATEANSLSSAISADLRADRARLPVDLVHKAKWGQRALLASFALLMIVAAAYFFLRSQQSGLSTTNSDTEPAQLQTEALARIPAAPLSKVVDPLPLNVRVDAAKQVQNKVVAQRPAVAKTPPVKQAIATAPAGMQTKTQTKAAPTDQVLYLPPGATSASAAATAAAIAEAIGKAPGNPPARDAAAVKGTVNSGAASSPPVPCTEALAALGLCVIQPASPKP